MLLSNRLKAIEEFAEKIIAEHKIKKPAVPITKIAKKVGLDIIPYELGEEASGVLVIGKNKKGTIGYNPKTSKVRQRFTIAHELGHYLLHNNSGDLFVDNYFLVKFRNNNSSYTPSEFRHEQEANAFAAALLMPRKFIEDEIYKKEFNKLPETEIISKLAEKFEVSSIAMTFRLTNLNMLF